MLIQAEKSISARMDQWAGNLSKVALQSRLCVKSRVLPYSDMALDWLVKPTTGQVMCHQRGHFEWQTTPSAPFRGVMQKPLPQIMGKNAHYRISLFTAHVGWKRRLSCYTCKRPLKDLLTLFKVVFRKVGQRCTHKPVQGTWIHMDFSRHPLRDEPLCIGQVFNYQQIEGSTNNVTWSKSLKIFNTGRHRRIRNLTKTGRMA